MEAPVTAATGALGPVVAMLSALLRRRGEYKLRRRTRKDVKIIRSKLKSIHSILWVIWERKDVDADGKELRMEAWRLADDMNDAIDDFILSLKRSNDGRRFLEDKTQPSPFQDLKRRAVDVSERCGNKWKLETAHTIFSSLFSRTKSTVDSGPAKRPRPRPRVFDLSVHKDISKLVDMEEPRKKLIDHLVGEGESTPQLKMACIHGAAGVGKTTLARLVYEAIEDKFQVRAFVSITSSHDMKEVLASIHEQVAVDSTVSRSLLHYQKHLISIISNFLEDKRYLVIIDDIWHCGEWETIKKSLPDNNLGSRIVTTSRVKAMTDKWHDDFDALVHKIKYLSKEQVDKMIALKLNDIVGEGFDYQHPIVNMCGGMPLAVVCMISSLAKEQDQRQEQQEGLTVVRTRDVQGRIEEQVKRNGIQNTPGFEPLVESLQLGYNDLPHHMLKTCLLFFSIYPQGHRFTRDGLVRRWIAEGFACKEEEAKDYFDQLVSKELLRGDVDKIIVQHPMMQNYLRGKLREDNFITCTSDGVPSSPTGRLCINKAYWPSSDATVDPLSGIDWHHIRSLVVFKDAMRVPYKHLQGLRVLDVQWSCRYRHLHLKDMCGLLRLRHLLLGGHVGSITEIPKEISRLRYLETLEVYETGIRRLPAEIGELKQLKTLDVRFNEALTELPREMGNLQHLETLRICKSNIREQAWEIIWTLKKLKTLEVSNIIYIGEGELQQLKDPDVSRNSHITELPKEIGNLQQLKNLDVSGNRGITYLHKEIGKLQHLETLNLSGTGITELPREVWNLQRLEVLELTHTRITKLPRDIGKLHHLETLAVANTEVRKVPREIGGLKKLKKLYVNIGTLPFEAGQVSGLKRLPRCVHQGWKNRDLVSSLAGEILSFREIHNYWVGDGGLVVGTMHMHIPRWIEEHFNNIGTLDIRIFKLEEQDLEILREMPNLYHLILRFEAVPRKPIAISGGGFPKLKFLTVDSRVPRITFQEGAMPILPYLKFEFQFYGGPPNTEHPMGIKHLVKLEEVSFRCNEWYRADSPCISSTIDVMRKEAKEHPNWIYLELPGGTEIYPNYSITQSSQDRNEACSSSGAEEIEEIQA